jgi:hypothetical protein
MIIARGGLDRTGCEGFIRALILQFAPPLEIPMALCFCQPNSECRDHCDAEDGLDLFFYTTRPVLGPTTSPSHPTLGGPHSSIKGLPLGFTCLAHEGAISGSTVELLGRILQASSKKSNDSFDILRQSPSDRPWRLDRYSDFWECCPAIARKGPNLEKSLCLALMLYTANEFAPQRRFNQGLALYGGPRAVLTAEIAGLSQIVVSTMQRYCCIWLWCVLIDSWLEGTDMTSTAHQLRSQLWTMYPESQSQEALRSILRSFFCSAKFEAALYRDHVLPL